MQAMHEGSSSGNAASGLWKAAVWAVALGAAGAASWYVFGPPGTRSATPSVEDATDAADRLRPRVVVFVDDART
jgi:hypothetical protein